MAVAVTTQENASKKTSGKRFTVPINFDFFKHPVCSYGHKEDFIASFKLNSSVKVILCSEDSATAYKLSEISLEYDAIFNARYATAIGELYAGTKSIPLPR